MRCRMKVVVIKPPRIMGGLLRLIFGMRKEE
ncbi:MAG: stage V sporulation protein SpoVM [Clostridia bacterium]|nr:stage V sporulation protein SpoVM [Clostridia bacterium]MBR3838719.1 stage V sporulation protein SpoVM [Clostridia bacterium]